MLNREAIKEQIIQLKEPGFVNLYLHIKLIDLNKKRKNL
jgi:hypothetical protein